VADSCYWIALLNPKDQLHQTAKNISHQLGDCRFFTGEVVMIEILNGLSHHEEKVRKKTVKCTAFLYGNSSSL